MPLTKPSWIISVFYFAIGPVTCECSRLGHGAVLVLCGDDAGSGTEGRRGQQGQLLHDAVAAGVVLGQLVEPLFQGVSQEVELLTGLIKASLGLKRERKEVQRKHRRVGAKEKLEEKKDARREKHPRQQCRDQFPLKAMNWHHISDENLLVLIQINTQVRASTSECALFSVTLPDPRSFMTFLAPSATADSILAW